MSELFTAVTPQAFDEAKRYAHRLVAKKGVKVEDLWEYMGLYIEEARERYRKRFVDWFQPRHIEQAQRELADAIIPEVWEVDY